MIWQKWLCLGLEGLIFSNSNTESMLPAGAESKHTAIPVHACVQTQKPKQKKRKEIVGIQKEAQDYSQEKRDRLVSLMGIELLFYI